VHRHCHAQVSHQQPATRHGMCDGRLQYKACEALAHLDFHTGNRVKIEAVGGIECIASAMRSHPTGSELQFSACRALAKLSRHADNLVKIEAAGGIECIATPVRSRPTNSKLRLSACLAVAKLAFMLTTGSRSRQQEESSTLPVPCAAILPTASYNSVHVGL
jgi:hypothetical protein